MTTAPSRRSMITAGAAGLAATALSAGAADASATHDGPRRRHGHAPRLSFRRDGSFKIVQLNDTQDDETTDARTIELVTKVIAQEEPDLVVFVGDNINGGPDTGLQTKQALNNVIAPVEAAGIPWAAQFGNHDEDSTSKTGMDESDMLEFFQRYPHNVNPDGARRITGTGNAVVPVRGRDGRTAFNVWLLDSGRYAPDTIAGQDFAGYPDWDWLRADQVEWYLETSRQAERAAGRIVPGVMFIHIPLWEHRFMWFASVDSRTEADHARAGVKHQIVGERNEDECPGPFNSGMFSAILHRGDVTGVYCGHDHVNTYTGSYYGVNLGYGPGSGFGTYGLGGAENHRLRGSRVFEVREDGSWTTRLVFARDLGIDLTNVRKPTTPAPLPRWA